MTSESAGHLTRSDSTTSNVSAVSLDSADLDAEKMYERAPWDIFGEAPGLGRVRIAKSGDMLPILTGYKAKKDGTAEVGVQFRYLFRF
jgi:hypothetical protein